MTIRGGSSNKQAWAKWMRGLYNVKGQSLHKNTCAEEQLQYPSKNTQKVWEKLMGDKTKTVKMKSPLSLLLKPW